MSILWKIQFQATLTVDILFCKLFLTVKIYYIYTSCDVFMNNTTNGRNHCSALPGIILTANFTTLMHSKKFKNAALGFT